MLLNANKVIVVSSLLKLTGATMIYGRVWTENMFHKHVSAFQKQRKYFVIK